VTWPLLANLAAAIATLAAWTIRRALRRADRQIAASLAELDNHRTGEK